MRFKGIKREVKTFFRVAFAAVPVLAAGLLRCDEGTIVIVFMAGCTFLVRYRLNKAFSMALPAVHPLMLAFEVKVSQAVVEFIFVNCAKGSFVMADGTIGSEPLLVHIFMALVARIDRHSKLILEDECRGEAHVVALCTIGLLMSALKWEGGAVVVKAF